jgi:hypothetical protein
MTAQDGAGAVSENSRRIPVWLVATALAVCVTSVCFSMPFIVHWAWPSLDSGVLMIGNMFLGLILGSAAVIGFFAWKWELRR